MNILLSIAFIYSCRVGKFGCYIRAIQSSWATATQKTVTPTIFSWKSDPLTAGHWHRIDIEFYLSSAHQPRTSSTAGNSLMCLASHQHEPRTTANEEKCTGSNTRGKLPRSIGQSLEVKRPISVTNELLFITRELWVVRDWCSANNMLLNRFTALLVNLSWVLKFECYTSRILLLQVMSRKMWWIIPSQRWDRRHPNHSDSLKAYRLLCKWCEGNLG